MPVDRWGRIDLAAWRAAVPLGVALAPDQRQPRSRAVQPAEAAGLRGGRCAVVGRRGAVGGRIPVPRLVDPDRIRAQVGRPARSGVWWCAGTRWCATRRRAGAWTGAGSTGGTDVVAAAAALRAAPRRRRRGARLAPLIDRIRTEVARTVPDVEVVGDGEPYVVTFSCLYVDGEPCSGDRVVSRSPPALPVRPPPCSRAMCWQRWGVATATSGCPCTGRPRRAGEPFLSDYRRWWHAAPSGPVSLPGLGGARAGEILDCLGQRCHCRYRAGGAAAGAYQGWWVLADDPAASNDIAAWCRLRDQEHLGSPAPHTYDIRRLH